MVTGGLLARSVLAALVLAGGAVLGGGADAATVYNYSFVQTGYDSNPVYGLGPSPATLSGTFSGTLNSAGAIDPSTLTDFHVTFAFDGTSLSYGNTSAPIAFSYHPGDDGSLAVIQALSNGYEVCIGIYVGFECGGRSALGSVSYDFYGAPPLWVSSTAPKVTLVSTTLDPVTPVSTTPVPATLPLFISALGGLGFVAARRRRPSEAGSPAAA
ncbi:MAG TPA: hypothetical protein VHA35_10820 [Dongiaceae bacterium]|jgi:hypothetical protein|nr:hypothetical protein [Dongiaceae bacterium]